MNDEGGTTTGAVAVLDPETGQEVGELAQPNTRAKLGKKGRIRSRKPGGGLFGDLLSRVPYPPRSYIFYFVQGSTELTPESQPILDALRKEVTETSEVQITGHTDTVGTFESNDKLSYERAVEIRAELVKRGLPVASARATGRGERELRIPTADGVSEAGNRRVEVILR